MKKMAKMFVLLSLPLLLVSCSEESIKSDDVIKSDDISVVDDRSPLKKTFDCMASTNNYTMSADVTTKYEIDDDKLLDYIKESFPDASDAELQVYLATFKASLLTPVTQKEIIKYTENGYCQSLISKSAMLNLETTSGINKFDDGNYYVYEVSKNDNTVTKKDQVTDYVENKYNYVPDYASLEESNFTLNGSKYDCLDSYVTTFVKNVVFADDKPSAKAALSPTYLTISEGEENLIDTIFFTVDGMIAVDDQLDGEDSINDLLPFVTGIEMTFDYKFSNYGTTVIDYSFNI